MFGISAYAQTSFASKPSGNVVLQKLLTVASTVTATLLNTKTIQILLSITSYISLGALNTFAINNNALNDANNTTVGGLLSTSTLLKNIRTTVSYVSSATSSLTPGRIFLQLLSIVVANTISILKATQTTIAAATSNIVFVTKTVGKTIDSGTTTATVFLTNVLTRLLSLSFTGTSTVSLSKRTNKLLTVVSTSLAKVVLLSYKIMSLVSTATTASLLKTIQIIKTIASSTTSVINVFKAKLLVATVTVAANLGKLFSRLLQTTSSATATIFTSTTRFVLLVTTVYTSVVAHFYRVLLNIEDTIIVPTKKVIVQVFAGFTDILVKPKKTNIVVIKQDDVHG